MPDAYLGSFAVWVQDAERDGLNRAEALDQVYRKVTATFEITREEFDRKIAAELRKRGKRDRRREEGRKQRADAPPVTSWSPMDIGPYLDGTVRPAEPSMGPFRDDGLQLLYPGKENAVIGEMESGKTWYCAAAAAAALAAGQTVVYVHFEEADPSDLVGRLQAMRVPDDQVRERLRFVAPEHRATPDRLAELLAIRPALVLLDGVNEALHLHGQTTDVDGAAEYRRVLVAPFMKIGAAVLSCDHVNKDPSTRGRNATGSVHKGNGLSGSLIMLETLDPFGRGLRGRSAVFVTKDRPGYLRQRGRPTNIPGKTYMGDLVIDATTDDLLFAFYPPGGTRGGTVLGDDDDPFPDPHAELDRQVFAAVEQVIALGQEPNVRKVRAAAGLGNTKTADALDRLVLAGRLIETRGKRDAREFNPPAAPLTTGSQDQE